MALVYLGLHDGEPHFRLDVGQGARSGRLESAVARRWDVLGPRADPAVAGRFPALADGRARLILEVLEADDRSARIRIDSTLRLAYDGAWDTAGLGLADDLTLTDREAEVAAWLLRAGEGALRDVVERTGLDAAEARRALAALVERGVVGETNSTGEARYFARPVARRGGRLPRDVARALVEPDAARAPSARDSLARSFRRWDGLRSVVTGRRARFAVAASPIVATFAAAEWMAVTGSGSFAGLLNVVGTIVVSLLAGVFPVLLLVASRRKGQPLPAASYALLGNPLLLGAVDLLFLAGILFHGLVIWDEPLERAAALAAAVVVALTGALARRGLLARRLTIELREEAAAGHAAFAVTAAGLPAEADVTFEYEDGETRVRVAAGEVPQFGRVRRATFEPRYGDGGAPAVSAVSEVKVWAHRVTPDDDSEGLTARVTVVAGDERADVDLAPSRGEAVLPVAHRPGAVEVSLTGSPTTPARELND